MNPGCLSSATSVSPFTLSGLTDGEWLDLILRGIQEANAAEIELPRVPPGSVQRRSTGTADAEASLRLGFEFYTIIKNYLQRCNSNLAPDSRILDFGCGWGRIIRFFMKDVLPENLYGVDIDPVVIDACRETMKKGHYAVIQPAPPLDFPAESFDLIYAYSVFSHLPETLHLKWLCEFSRILKPGGVLVATTLGRSFINVSKTLREAGKYNHAWQRFASEAFKDAALALAEYDAGKVLFSATRSPNYGLALIPRVYVKTVWTQFMEFHDFIDDPAFLAQALIVMKKTSLPYPSINSPPAKDAKQQAAIATIPNPAPAGNKQRHAAASRTTPGNRIGVRAARKARQP